MSASTDPASTREPGLGAVSLDTVVRCERRSERCAGSPSGDGRPAKNDGPVAGGLGVEPPKRLEPAGSAAGFAVEFALRHGRDC